MKTKFMYCFLYLFLLSSCAVNRVDYVRSISDTKSLYKVPVIYGIGIKDDSLPIRYYGILGPEFGEYSLRKKQGSAGCLGSADTISISFHGLPIKHKEIIDNKQMHYYLLMVPPGYYALHRGSALHEANPSAYFKIERGYPQYLGNFWISKTDLTKKDQRNYFHSYQKITSPIEYNMSAAQKTLQKFTINPEELKIVAINSGDGFAKRILCTP